MTPKPLLAISLPEKGEYLSSHLLVVDDMADQREWVCKMIEVLGYRVACVASGEEAVAYLEQSSVDLLVLDMIMDPAMDGLETYKKTSNTIPINEHCMPIRLTQVRPIPQGQWISELSTR